MQGWTRGRRRLACRLYHRTSNASRVLKDSPDRLCSDSLAPNISDIVLALAIAMLSRSLGIVVCALASFVVRTVFARASESLQLMPSNLRCAQASSNTERIAVLPDSARDGAQNLMEVFTLFSMFHSQDLVSHACVCFVRAYSGWMRQLALGGGFGNYKFSNAEHPDTTIIVPVGAVRAAPSSMGGTMLKYSLVIAVHGQV